MTAVSVLSHGYNVIQGALANNQFSDLELVTVEGKSVSCHKVVLCAVSDRVKSMLDRKDSNKLVIRNVSHSGLEKLVKFIYEGRVDIYSDESLIDFADAFTVMRCNMGQKVADMIKNITLNDEDSGSTSQLSQEKLAKCETCDKSFPTMRTLRRHMKQVHIKGQRKKEKKLFICERCKAKYKVKNGFKVISILINSLP